RTESVRRLRKNGSIDGGAALPPVRRSLPGASCRAGKSAFGWRSGRAARRTGRPRRAGDDLAADRGAGPSLRGAPRRREGPRRALAGGWPYAPRAAGAGGPRAGEPARRNPPDARTGSDRPRTRARRLPAALAG